MDEGTARQLAALTAEFYRTQAAAFSATRSRPWPGWKRLVQEARLRDARALQVLDVACGNGRFGRFLHAELPGCTLAVHGVDSCAELAASCGGPSGGASAVHEQASPAIGSFQQLDVVGALLEGKPLCRQLSAPACDLSVSFGFLHHVPCAECRVRLLQTLAAKTRPGGCVAVSLWKFMDDARLAAKAEEATRHALACYPALELDDGDYLLGWQQAEGVFRYCHHFKAHEADGLARALDGSCTLLARFASDGRGSAGLNEYLLWRKMG